MNKIFKRILLVISSGTFTIAACLKAYGMPADINYFKVVKTQTEDNTPIEGLSVSLVTEYNTLTGFTDNEGVVDFNFRTSELMTFSAIIEDIDGEENQGYFISKEVNLTDQDTSIVIMQKQ